MNKTAQKIIFLTIATLVAVTTSLAIVASAQTTATGTPLPKTAQAKLEKTRARAEQEISRRVDFMNQLITKIGDMQKLSASDKSTLNGELQSNITSLQDLKSKIDSDADLATIQSDVKSVTSSYRIFALVIPRDNIIIAADKISSTADSLTVLAMKISTRLSDPNFTANSTTTLQATFNDIKSKLIDAATQAQNAINTVVPLVPDNGDKTVMASNKAALKTARTDIKAGTTDIKTALSELKTMRKEINKLKPKTPSSTASTTNNQ